MVGFDVREFRFPDAGGRRADRLHPCHRPGRRRGGQTRRARHDAVSARAERLPAHRAREVDLPELRCGRRVRRHVQPAVRRHQSDQGRRRVRRRDQGGRRVAGFSLGPAALRVRLLRAAVRTGGRVRSEGARVRRQFERGRDPRAPRHADRAGPEQPVPRSIGRREPGPVRADARRRVSGWRARPPGEDRHGVAQPQHARSDALPDPPCDAPPDGRRLVHLPDVRLRAPAVGRDRGDHALALHAGVRGSPPALRLARGAPVRGRAAAAVPSSRA